MLRGRTYLLQLRGELVAEATISPLKYRVDPATGERFPAAKLVRGETGVCGLQLDRQIAFDSASELTLLDPVTAESVGSVRLHFALRRSENVVWQELDVDKRARCAQNEQHACVLWLTGLSGAGKSTIANLVERRLHALGRHTYLLDGDNVRHGLNKDLGFTEADRVENIRRVAEVARLMVDAGLIVIVALISPFASERRMARGLVDESEFIEIHVDAPLAVAEQRDPKGLYAKARSGELINFTGIDSPYEPPEAPEVYLDTTTLQPDEAAQRVVDAVLARELSRGFAR
jgi:bifunctional enzyme CysN/CysC